MGIKIAAIGWGSTVAAIATIATVATITANTGVQAGQPTVHAAATGAPKIIAVAVFAAVDPMARDTVPNDDVDGAAGRETGRL
ncbi:hypothetical protein [Thiolapillus sp.]|uniref:hypothetical protein n=1 Tax=Thiolapillus sp. TaxID=2017437 RepID=UPI003AF8D53B